MKEFNSLFELFAAFNFVYVLSTDFNDKISNKLINKFEASEKTLNQIIDFFGHYESILNDYKKESVKISLTLSDELSKMDSKKAEFYSNKTKWEGEINSAKVGGYFNYYCLFSGLYCLLILYLNGFDYFNHHNWRTYLFIGNLLYVIGLIILSMEKFKVFTTNFISTLITFFIATFVSVGLCVLLCFTTDNTFIESNYFIIHLTLLLPIAHFI